MGVSSVNLLSHGSARVTLAGIEYTDVYQVRTTDSATDTAAVVLAQTAFPSIGEEHPYGGSFVDSITPTQDRNDRLNWLVTVSFTPARPDRETIEKQTQPTQRTVLRRWQSIPIEKVATKDRNGDPILNTAGIAFDPPVTYRSIHALASFQRWESTFTDEFARAYSGKINAETWGTLAAGTVMCTGITAEESYEDGVRYWLVTYEFEHNPDGWQLEILSNGILQKTSDGLGHERIQDDNGDDITEPVPLNSSGRAVQASQLPEGAYYVTAEVYDEVDFNGLGLPLSS